VRDLDGFSAGARRYINDTPLTHKKQITSHFSKEPHSTLAMDLLDKLLTLNPADRITAAAALKHPFFSTMKVFEPEDAGPFPSDRIDSSSFEVAYSKVASVYRALLHKVTPGTAMTDVTDVTSMTDLKHSDSILDTKASAASAAKSLELKLDGYAKELKTSDNPDSIRDLFVRIQKVVNKLRDTGDSKRALVPVDAVRDAMTRFAYHEKVCETGILCLAFVSALADQHQRMYMFGANMIRDMIIVWKRFPENTIIKWRACDFIGNIVSIMRGHFPESMGECAERLVQLDVIRLIFDGMRLYPKKEKVVEAGLFGIMVIAKMNQRATSNQIWRGHRIEESIPYWRRLAWEGTSIKMKNHLDALELLTPLAAGGQELVVGLSSAPL